MWFDWIGFDFQRKETLACEYQMGIRNLMAELGRTPTTVKSASIEKKQQLINSVLKYVPEDLCDGML